MNKGIRYTFRIILGIVMLWGVWTVSVCRARAADIKMSSVVASLSPSKENGPIPGDINKDGMITPSDALLVFQCYLGQGVCGGEADVNQDNLITPNDALCIFKEYLGIPSCLLDIQKKPVEISNIDIKNLETMQVEIPDNYISELKSIIQNNPDSYIRDRGLFTLTDIAIRKNEPEKIIGFRDPQTE